MNARPTTARAALLGLSIVLMSGCGSTSTRSASTPDRADQALTTAQSALNEARAARAAAEAANAKADQILATLRASPSGGAVAQEALQAARAAQTAAEDAKRLALQAQDAAERLDLKTDRMFEKSMRK